MLFGYRVQYSTTINATLISLAGSVGIVKWIEN